MIQGYAKASTSSRIANIIWIWLKIADLWMHGSVVRSWLLELAPGALKQDLKLEQLKGYV